MAASTIEQSTIDNLLFRHLCYSSFQSFATNDEEATIQFLQNKWPLQEIYASSPNPPPPAVPQTT